MKRVNRRHLALAHALLLASTSIGYAQAPVNPLLAASALPYDAPPFDRIHDADYQPAIDRALASHQAEIDRIAADPAPPTFDNVVVAMERSGAALTRAVAIFENITQSNTDPILDHAKEQIEPALQAHADGIHLNGKLFARLKTVYDARAGLKLDAKSRFLLEQTFADFVHAGAALSATDQQSLRELNQQITKLETSFQQKLLAATAAGAVVVADRRLLTGLVDRI